MLKKDTMESLIFATHNKHKLHEVSQLVANLYKLKNLDDAGITEDIPENEPTLEGNARIKAQYVFKKTNTNVFADDTGLEVEALNGAPGVISARYAGPESDPKKNLAKLLAEMKGIYNRKARFRTVICLILDGREYLFEGVVQGHLIEQPTGNEGFGYDPVFIPDGYDQTFAQMPLQLKNTISHRAKVIQSLIVFLKNRAE
jgi:XTP/dITP diphosphohydrolase